MEQTLKLSAYACVMAFGLGLVAGTSTYAQSSGSQSQGQGSPVQEPTQPAQPQQPTKSPDENSNKNTQDQFPTPPVVAGNAKDAPLPGPPPPGIRLFPAPRFLHSRAFFFAQCGFNSFNTTPNPSRYPLSP